MTTPPLLTMGSQDVFTGTFSQPGALTLDTQYTYWGCPDVARYPEGSQGKHGHMVPPQAAPQGLFLGAGAGCALYKGG